MNILLDVPFRNIKVKTPKDALELLSKTRNAAAFHVVSEVKGVELLFDYLMSGDDANVDDQDDDEMSEASKSIPLHTSDIYIRQ